MTNLNLKHLEIAIKTGTYNVESSSISQADAGEMLTVEINTTDEPIDFLAFTDLINSENCIIIQVAARHDSIVAFFIEEKLESGN